MHNFCSENGCADGESPEGGLLEGSDGLVYGTTNIGGNTGTCDTPSGCGTVFSLSGVTPNPNQFVPVTPCRLVDTRSGNGGSRAIQAGSFAIFDVRQLSLTNGCGDLSGATAYSLNLTLIPKDHQSVSYVTMWPTGDNQPWVSTMNSPDGRTKASAAIVRAGAGGAVNIFATGTTDVGTRHQRILRASGFVHADVPYPGSVPHRRYAQFKLSPGPGRSISFRWSSARLSAGEQLVYPHRCGCRRVLAQRNRCSLSERWQQPGIS